MTNDLHSTDLEQAVLGALLIEPDAIIDVLTMIAPSDFYDPVHRDIFQAMTELFEEAKGFDLLSLHDRMNAHRELQNAGGSAYLAELTANVHSTANVMRHASLLKDKAIHRAVARAGERIMKLGSDHDLDATEVVERAEQQLLSIARVTSNADPETPFDIGRSAYDYYAELHAADDPRALFGIQTGFSALDNYLQGLQPGAFTIIAARPSVGKTSLALNIAQHVAEHQHKPVAFFSLEMDKRQVLDRLLASGLDIDGAKLRLGQLSDSEFAKVPQALERWKDSSFYIDDDPDASLSNLRSKARRMKMQHGLALLVVDYLQLIEVRDRSAGENRTQQVTYLSRSLKNLARELDCPIVALSQLSRAVEQRGQPIPILSDLRDSGAIEQDADMVLMLYREDMYNEDCSDPGLTDVYIRKNRNGPTGRVSLFFDAKRMTFRSVQRTGVPTPAAETPQVSLSQYRSSAQSSA